MSTDLLQLAQTFGLPITFLIIAVVTVVRGDWIPRKSHEREMAAAAAHHKETVETITRLHGETIERLERANEEWRFIAIHGLDAAEEAALVGKALVQRNVRAR